jgi:hypothetical protein
LLKKLIKNDFKSQYWFFAIVFVAALILPFAVFLVTPNFDRDELQYAWRLLMQALGPSAVVIISVIFSAITLADNFSGNSAYLMFSIPAKTRSHIASKAIIFYFFFVLTIIFAITCSCLVDMDFSPLASFFKSFTDQFETLIAVTKNNVFTGISTADIYINTISGFINMLGLPLLLYAFILAAISFGQLWGNHKKAGKIVFVISGIAVLSVFAVFYDLVTQYYFKRVWMFPEGFTIYTLYSIRDILNVVLMIAVIIALLRFSNWTFTKKINVL